MPVDGGNVGSDPVAITMWSVAYSVSPTRTTAGRSDRRGAADQRCSVVGQLLGVVRVVEVVDDVLAASHRVRPVPSDRRVVQHRLARHARHERTVAADPELLEHHDLESVAGELTDQRLGRAAAAEDGDVEPVRVGGHGLGHCTHLPAGLSIKPSRTRRWSSESSTEV